MVPCGLENLLDDFTFLGTAVGEPAAEREERNLQTSVAQVSELHPLGIVGGFDNGVRHGDGGCFNG